MRGKRTPWTRLADAAMIIGSWGQAWWRALWQARVVSWALRHVRWQWFDGHHWIDRDHAIVSAIRRRR